MKTLSILSGTLGLLLFVATGCYTVLHHPSEVPIAASADEGGGPTPCGDCHYESEWLGYYDHELIWGYPGLLAYDGYTWWDDYYRRPWWYDDYWTDYGRYSESHPDGAGRSTWDRRRLRRGESPSDAPSGGIYPGAHSSGGGGGSSASPSSGSSSSESKSAPQPEETHRKKKPRR